MSCSFSGFCLCPLSLPADVRFHAVTYVLALVSVSKDYHQELCPPNRGQLALKLLDRCKARLEKYRHALEETSVLGLYTLGAQKGRAARRPLLELRHDCSDQRRSKQGTRLIVQRTEQVLARALAFWVSPYGVG